MILVRFLFLVAFWGFSFIAIHHALSVVPPGQGAFFRVGIAGVFLFFLALLRRDPWFPKRRDFYWHLVIGCFGLGIPWMCLFWGEQYVAPAVASIINSSVPMFTLLFAWLVIPKQKADSRQLVGILIAFAGILLVFYEPLFGQVTQSSVKIKGLVAIVIMAVSYGLAATLVKRAGAHVAPTWAMFTQSISASILIIPTSFMLGETWVGFSDSSTHPALWSLMYLGLFSTAIGGVFFFRVIHAWGPVRASAVTYLVPVVAIATDRLILKTLPSAFELGGVLTILLGVSFMNGLIRFRGKPWRALRTSS